MRTMVQLIVATVICIGALGCEYVRPTLNQPLEKWDRQYGYRFPNLPPPGEGNSNSLFVMTSFSGGGTRASTLAFGALRELAQHSIKWEGRETRLIDELDMIYALSGGTFTGAYYALFGDRMFHDFESRFLRKDWESELNLEYSDHPAIGFVCGLPISAASTSCLNCWMKRSMTARPTAIS